MDPPVATSMKTRTIEYEWQPRHLDNNVASPLGGGVAEHSETNE